MEVRQRSREPREAAARSWNSRPLVLASAAVVLLLALTLGAWAIGYRANIQTAHVAIPDAQASPDDVVRAYVDAYNHRDFAGRAELYPLQTVPSWYEKRRAIGTMNDLQIISSTKDVTYGPNSPYWMVVVHLRFTGLQGSDLNLEDGPTGWAYWLERGPDGAWRIADHGNG